MNRGWGWAASLMLLAMPGLASAQVLRALDAAKACKQDPDGVYRVPIKVFLARLLKDNPVPLEVADLDAPPRSIAERVVAAGPCAPDAKCTALNGLFSAAQQVLQHREQDGLVLGWSGASSTEPADLEKQLGYLFTVKDNPYEIVCRNGAPLDRQIETAKPTPNSNPWLSFAIAQDIDAAAKPFKQRSPATLSFKSDDGGDSQSWSLKGAIVWGNILPVNKGTTTQDIRESQFRPTLAPFISVNEQSNKDPAKAVDDLAFGLRLEGRLTRVTPFYLTGSWTTDVERRESSLTKLEFKVRPPLDRLPAYGRYLGGLDGDGFSIQPYWRLFAVADYAEVGDPGDKASLKKTARYQRIGYDIEGALRFGRGTEAPSWTLSAAYKLRDETSQGPGDAQLLDLALVLTPSDTSPFSFGLSYERGEIIDTLAPVEQVKASLGFRH